MVINLICPRCKSNLSVGSKVCKKCGHIFSNRKKYRVIVEDQNGKRISKVIDNISMAKKFESKLKTKILESSLLGIKTVPIIDEVWPKYLEWAKDAKKSWKDDEMRWEYHVESHLTGKKMDKITGFDVQRVISYGLVQAYSQVKEKRSKSFCPFLCSHFSPIFSDIA